MLYADSNPLASGVVSQEGVVQQDSSPSPSNALMAEKATQSFTWGKAIALCGTSTAGKTSIIKNMLSIDPQMLERGIDLACQSLPIDYVKAHHKEAF